MQMLKTQRVRRALESLGYTLRRTAGSEFVYAAPNGEFVVITLGHREVSSNSVRKALKLGDVSWEAFMERY